MTNIQPAFDRLVSDRISLWRQFQHSETKLPPSLERAYLRVLAQHLAALGAFKQPVAQLNVYVQATDSGLAERVETLESKMEYAIRPALSKMAMLMERYGERDAIPAASSAEYEWQERAGKIVKTVEDFLATYQDNDLEKRLACHVTLLEQLRDLLKLARAIGDRNLRDAVLMLHDALSGQYSEDITGTQAQVIEDAVYQLQDLDWEKEQVRNLHKELRASGCETVPSDRFVGLYRERSKA